MDTELEDILHELDTLQAENAGMQAENAGMQAENAAMQAENDAMQSQFQQAQRRCVCARRRLRVQAGLAFSALLGAMLLSPANRAAIAQGYGLTLATLNTRLLVVESKTQYMNVDATARSATFSGCNLIVNDGNSNPRSVVTNAAGQGIGNLIIGYNALRNISNNPDVRTGSHNLIVGNYNNYSSYGGVVAGSNNTVSGHYASVTGGNFNTASSGEGSVSGGAYNTARDISSVVSGGYYNTANSGIAASVSGGDHNTASGDYAWAAGGYHSP